MHEQGIVHRDLKLENLVVVGGDENLQGKLIDFGLTLRHGDWEMDLQDQGKVGTYPFMSPEMFYNKRETYARDRGIVIKNYEFYDAGKNDVWSLGVAMWAFAMGTFIWEDLFAKDCRFTISTRGEYSADFSNALGRQQGLRYLARSYGEKRNYMATSALIDLLEKMICPEEKRWTMAQCLNHPWFASTDHIALRDVES